MILFLKHISIEGPGTIATYFKERGYSLRILELQDGAAVSGDLSGVEALVVLGGPMNVYEEDKYPFLAQEDVLIKSALAKRIPLLGICLGSQLMAKATGAKVSKAPVKEVGWFSVNKTALGQEDELFKGLTNSFTVFQWHEDTFTLPDGAKHLAASTACAHQAYRLGDNAYALQFHVEVDEPIIESWIKAYFKVNDVDAHPQGAAMMAQYQKVKQEFHGNAATIYKNFERVMRKHKPRA